MPSPLFVVFVGVALVVLKGEVSELLNLPSLDFTLSVIGQAAECNVHIRCHNNTGCPPSCAYCEPSSFLPDFEAATGEGRGLPAGGVRD